MLALNATQKEILNLFQYELPEENLLEIKDIISNYLAKELIESADSDWDSQGLSNEVMEQWKNEHNRIKIQ